MKLGRDGRAVACVLLLVVGIGVHGCASAGHRNVTEAIIVTTTPSMSEDETKLVLELRDAREELSLGEVDAFLASDRAARLSRANRSQLLERRQAVRQTLPQARRDLADGVAIIRPNPDGAADDGNIVVYVAGKSAVHVLFSRAEIGQLLASRECADDLTTLRYTHPGFDPAQLAVLRERVTALNPKVANLAPSKSELELLRAEAATRLLERCLRDAAVPLPGGAPLLTSGPLTSMRSPKLTAALKDPSVVERILRDHNPDTLRALVFLVSRNIIELDYP
ncbi:hypothetical protein RAS1_40630 [Phycisphaerae bacterium RAS1]|nr:hypothetical protein RAS1_40630 [Phycisphaerae bacterium RAS1]